MSYIVGKEADFPSPSTKIKLNKVIGRYKLILRTFAYRYDIGEIKFGLADLYIGRNEPGDYKEAMKLYNDIIQKPTSPFLLARALSGKAELFISENDKKKIEEGIELSRRAKKILEEEVGKEDFFYQKSVIVEAELLTKKGKKEDVKIAAKLYESLIKSDQTNYYFRARAMIGISELNTYTAKPKTLKKYADHCDSAIELLRFRPQDYFSIKAKMILVEVLTQIDSKKNVNRIIQLCNQVLLNKYADKETIARTRLDKADVSKKNNAEKLIAEVKKTEGLPDYIYKKAKLIEADLKKRKK
ncbi:hypothetical protein ACFLZ2_00600 [Candidatus Margulisiibacteriota bacterium]